MGRVKADYVLKERNKKTKIWFYIIFFSCLVLLELFFAYNYLSYRSLVAPNETALVAFGMSLFNFGTAWLPLTGDVIGECFGCLLDVWYINVIILVSLFSLHRKRGKFRGVEYGSQRWMNKKELKEFELTADRGIIPVANRVFIDPVNNRLPNLNEMVLASSGSGKSFRKLIPDIMYQLGNYVITDVKGDLFKWLYKILHNNGYDIRVLNLENLKYSNGFNPIAYCEDDTDIDRLVSTFVLNSRREGASVGEAIWEDTLSMLLFSTVKYVLCTEGEEKTFYRCLQLVSSIFLENGRVSPSCEMERVMKELELKDPYNSAVTNWNWVKQSAAETLQSVLISMTSRLRLWANEDVRILTQVDDIGIDDLADKNKKVAIFVIVPESDRTYNCIKSMFISTAVQRLKFLAKSKYDGTLPKLVSFELDEFANIGILPDWDDVVSTVRSQNIRIMMILQDLQQLKKNYEKSHSTIRTNCAIFTYLGTTEEKTTEMISKRLGKTTIDHENTSYQTQTIAKGNIQNQEIGRELLTQAEVEGMPKDKCIVFLEGCYPIYGDKFKTEEHPLFPLLGYNKGKAKANNTDPKEVFGALYEEHRQRYLNYLEQIKASKGNIFDEMEAGMPRERTAENSLLSEEESKKAFEAFEEMAQMEDTLGVEESETQEDLEAEFDAVFSAGLGRFSNLKKNNE